MEEGKKKDVFKESGGDVEGTGAKKVGRERADIDGQTTDGCQGDQTA